MRTSRPFYAAVEQGEAGTRLPDFVRAELEAYLDCGGLLSRGFAVLECGACDERRLVAFSCKRRGFCPGCLGRRMAQTGANLLDHVLPRVPLRQFVLTVPFELRPRLAYDGALLGLTSRIFVDSLLAFYRRRMLALGAVDRPGNSGAVTVVQRTSADLRLNPHLHTLALDGLFAPDDDGASLFHPSPELDDLDVADLLQTVRVRLLRAFIRRGVIEDDEALTLVPDRLAEREPALARLAVAAVSGLAPAGPERRERPAIALRGRPGLSFTAPLTAAEYGFSLHAATTAAADDERGREGTRTLRAAPSHRPGQAFDSCPTASSASSCAAPSPTAPPPSTSTHLALVSAVRRGAAAALQHRPLRRRARSGEPLASPGRTAAARRRDTWTSRYDGAGDAHRSRWRPWRELLKRSFAIDVKQCDRCGGPLELRRLLTEPAAIRRFLRHIGTPEDPAARAPARDPPYYRSRVLRQRLATSPAQQDQPALS